LVPARDVPVYVKRDDLTGFAVAGHKARQLELLVGAALAAGCDALVTGGGPGSNFCAAAAVAASVAGLGCELVLYGAPPARPHPNLASALAAGAHVSFTGNPDRAATDSAVFELADELTAGGRLPYAIPRGGATPLGAAAMVGATRELAGQLDALGVEPAAVVVATGSGGACAGISVGTTVLGRPWRVVAASVSRPPDEAAAQVAQLSRDCAALLGVDPPADGMVQLVDVRGPGFGQASDEGEAAARLALRTEGLVLDPVYTAKAYAVVLRLLREDASGPIVFWHTGGLFSAAAHLEKTA
jgi:D-cysteine desulfhydrase